MTSTSNRTVTSNFLHERTASAAMRGYKKQKWIEFCERMIEAGLECSLYEARSTVSKYVTVRERRSGRSFKVRFSNHMPNLSKELEQDCDFFVGHSNTKITTTLDAIAATFSFFRECGHRVVTADEIDEAFELLEKPEPDETYCTEDYEFADEETI